MTPPFLWFLKMIKIWRCFRLNLIFNTFSGDKQNSLDRKSWFHSITIEFWRSAHMLIGINSLLGGHHYDTTLNTGWIWSMCGKFQYTNVLVISTVKGKDLWPTVNCTGNYWYLRSMALNQIAMWRKFIDILDLLYFTT